MSSESAEQLVKEGFSLVQQGKVRAALKVGRRLKRMRHILGYEIIAMAWNAMGKTEMAVMNLEKAVSLKPLTWRLWELLGNYRSDLEMYEASNEAYRKALACPDVNWSSIQFNLAVVLSRQGMCGKALAALDEVTDESMAFWVKSQRLRIFNELNRFDEAMTLGEAYLREILDDEEAPTELVARVGAEVAWAFWYGARDGAGALELALTAVTQDHHLSRALYLIRQIEGRVSPANKLHRLLVDGDWTKPAEDGTLLRFFVSYDVVAESPEKAMEYVRRCEEADLRESLTIDKCEEIEPRPSDPAGVYRIGKYHLYSQGAS